MFTILAIGNSFSEDATKYLYEFAKCDDTDLKIVNLYIGGCCLEKHWNNITSNLETYDYQLNGISTGRKVSINATLHEDQWDIITMQQCSGLSGISASYYPFARLLSEYIKKESPESKQLIHQTWAYEIDSTHEQFELYNLDQDKMHQALTECYRKIATDLSLDIIPSGNVIKELRSHKIFNYKLGGKSLCRDGYHMDELYGRYTLAAVWYAYIFRKDITNNPFLPPQINGFVAKKDNIKLIKETIMKIV